MQTDPSVFGTDHNKKITNPHIRNIDQVFTEFKAHIHNMPENRVDSLFILSELVQVVTFENELLHEVFNTLIETGEPGSTLSKRIQFAQNELDENEQTLTTLHEQKRKLLDLEKQNQAMIEEKQNLEIELSDLKHISEFDKSALDELKEKISELNSIKPWISDCQQVRKEVVNDLPVLLQLSQQAKEVIGHENALMFRKLTDELNAIRNEINTNESDVNKIKNSIDEAKTQTRIIESKIAEKKEEYQKLQEERNKRQKILEAYIQTDKEIANVIDNAESKKAEKFLDEIEQQLKQVDSALKKAINMNQAEYEKPIITL